MNLSSDQKYVLDCLLDWHKNAKDQFVTVGGFAGTGKTTLIAKLSERLHKQKKNFKIAFISYTGKAARVLENTLIEAKALHPKDSVSTIHSLIYKAIENPKTNEIVGWEKKDDLKVSLIVIDEASMVDEQIWRDLLSYSIPIIAVGDHGQLPPIRGNFNLMQKPQFKLEEIHRQAKGNPIIEVSIEARKKGIIPYKKYSKTVMKLDRGDADTAEIVQDLLQSYDQNTMVLCGYNYTRIKLNKYIRGLLEIEGDLKTGDRVICLRNNHKKQIFNGQTGTVNEIMYEDELVYEVKINFDDGQYYVGKILKEQFESKEAINFTKNRKKTLDVDLFDFGYALTVHKSQGSQAQRVILFEERFAQMDEEMWRRWLYTGITRAQEELYIVGSR